MACRRERVAQTHDLGQPGLTQWNLRPASRPDFIAAIAALVGVLVFDTLPGLFIGISLSVLLLLYRTSRPNVAVLGRVPGTTLHWSDVSRHPENEQVPGVVVVRVEGGIFFANADRVRQAIRARASGEGVRAIVLDAQTVPFVDVTAAEMLAQLRDELGRQGVALLLAREVGQVRDVLRRSGPEDDTSAQHIFPTVEEAVEGATTIRSKSDPRTNNME